MIENDLIYWINRREAIRELKESGAPKPWSQDPVFQVTYFCNVRREDDRVTKWIADRWRKGDNPNLEAAMVLARMFNLPSHLKWLEDLNPTRPENKEILGPALFLEV